VYRSGNDSGTAEAGIICRNPEKHCQKKSLRLELSTEGYVTDSGRRGEKTTDLDGVANLVPSTVGFEMVGQRGKKTGCGRGSGYPGVRDTTKRVGKFEREPRS